MAAPEIAPLIDAHGRRIHYLRISLTAACNFRCAYCQPGGPLSRRRAAQELSAEEIVRLASVLARLGVSKIRLTGGEPTLRRDLPEVVAALAALPGIRDLSLSTHGLYLGERAHALASAGLGRVNVSLDTLRPERFRQLAGIDGLERVLAGLRAAREAGLTPIKLNAVPMRGVNDDEFGDLIALAAELGAELRFIELMPLEVARPLYEARHMGREQILERLAACGDWRPVERRLAYGPARIYRREADGLEIGLIDPLSPNFCARCNRLRITWRGELRSCLFGVENVPLRPLLDGPDWEAAVEAALRRAVMDKPEKHRLERFDDGGLGSLSRVGG